MDILTHALSGVAIGTVIAGIAHSSIKQQIGYIAIGGFGAILPDIDAISLWSRFDASFGKLLGLAHRGKDIYSAKFWYSHHGFMHSIVACIAISILFCLLLHLIKTRFQPKELKLFPTRLFNNKYYLLSFGLGFLLHLLGDLPTPSSSWGGINIFWPSKQYLGGTGEIWWWNNYDIFLIISGIIISNLIVLLVGKLQKRNIFKLTLTIFLLGFTLTFFQIKTRPCNFAYADHTTKYDQFEQESKNVQKQILGNKLYKLMLRFDSKMRINF